MSRMGTRRSCSWIARYQAAACFKDSELGVCMKPAAAYTDAFEDSVQNRVQKK